MIRNQVTVVNDEQSTIHAWIRLLLTLAHFLYLHSQAHGAMSLIKTQVHVCLPEPVFLREQGDKYYNPRETFKTHLRHSNSIPEAKC